MTALPAAHLLLLAASLGFAACSDVRGSSGPPPGGTWQGSAAPPMQTESQRMMMQNAPVTQPTPQPRPAY